MPVSSPTSLRLGEIVLTGGTTMSVPKATTVTPTANALVILLIQYGSAGTTSPSPSQPAWANQAWTQIAVTTEAGSSEIQVGAWWTIATSSPSAADVDITFSGNGFSTIGAGGALFEYASGFDTSTPIRQFKSITAASIAGGTELTDTFTSTPLSGSQLLEIGMAAGNSTQFFASGTSGWTKPTPIDEGGSQTSYVAYAAGSNGSTYGGDFGDSTPGHDHNNGAVFLAFEIQEPASSTASGAGFMFII